MLHQYANVYLQILGQLGLNNCNWECSWGKKSHIQLFFSLFSLNGHFEMELCSTSFYMATVHIAWVCLV